MTGSPVHGNSYVIPMNSPAYIQEYANAITVNPGLSSATISTPAEAIAAVQTELNGVPGVYEFTIPIDGASTADYDGKYFLLSSQSNTFCVWFYDATIGTATPPSVTGATGYVKVSYATGASIVAMISAIRTAMVGFPDFSIAYDATTITFTTSQGGLCSDPDISVIEVTVTGLLLSVTTPATGGWAKLGLLNEDATFEPTPNKINSLEKKETSIDYTYVVEISLMNVNQRARDILKAEFDGKDVNMAFMNESSTDNPVLIIHDIPIDIFLDPFGGDVLQMKINGTRNYVDPDTFVVYWTYEMVYAA